MAKLGFLGLGLMGYPMARNLLRAGHEVAVWSNTAAKARKLADAEKGKFCATPKEVAENADVLFLCVGDTEMAKDVILGANGIIEGVRSGTVVIDCSTIAVSASRQIGQALKAKGVDFLDAPVTGSTPGAEGGNLTFMIGGDQGFLTGSALCWTLWARRSTSAAAPGWGYRQNSRRTWFFPTS